MTTNVFDCANAVVASDSRWSIPLGFAIAYVDDVDFDKIVVGKNDGLIYMFAGNSAVISEWKNWISSDAKIVQNRPTTNSIAICLIDKEKKTIVFCRGEGIDHDGSRFAGTGATFAFACWSNNKQAVRAVKTAIFADIQSGGEVKYFEIASESHNLSAAHDFHGITKKLIERGFIMYLNNGTQQSVPIKEAASNDPRIKEMIGKVEAGGLVPSAPCPSMFNEWTEAEEKELDSVLAKYIK
jgi:hypothetical protein